MWIQFNEMRKHCKWRAVEILKAIKEGREPRPIVEDVSPATDAIATSNNATDVHTTSSTAPIVQHLKGSSTILNHQAPIVRVKTILCLLILILFQEDDFSEPLPADYYTFVESTVDITVTAEAQAQARYAISALIFDDIPSAIVNLEKCLKILQPYRK